MRKIYQTEKYFFYSKKVARRELLKREKRTKRLKHQRRMALGKPHIEYKRQQDSAEFSQVHAPKTFSFLKNTSAVVSFLAQLEKNLEQQKPTFVVLGDVEEIDYGALTVLLSVMVKFQERGIRFNGDFPDDKSAQSLLWESGFFDELQRGSRNRNIYYIGRDNQFCTHANKHVSPTLGESIIADVSETVWGEKRSSRGFQRILIELMHNTNNHAVQGKKGDKHWWLSVNHDREKKKVSFVFMDHGIGIFSSLHGKQKGNKWYGWQEIVRSVFGATTDDYNLKLLLEGKIHATVTGKSFRGKGLPGVREVLDRGQISNLYIITNNVYANVSQDKYELMRDSFKGTFFYWELSSENVSQVWPTKFN